MCYFHVQYFRLKNSKVSIPKEETNASLKKKLAEAIKSGHINIGKPVVPQTFKKTTIKDGELVEEEITVNGRKIPLKDIREKLLNKYNSYMREIKTDEEYESLSHSEIVELLKRLQEYSEDTDRTIKREIKKI